MPVTLTWIAPLGQTVYVPGHALGKSGRTAQSGSDAPQAGRPPATWRVQPQGASRARTFAARARSAWPRAGTAQTEVSAHGAIALWLLSRGRAGDGCRPGRAAQYRHLHADL